MLLDLHVALSRLLKSFSGKYPKGEQKRLVHMRGEDHLEPRDPVKWGC
jgi:hypothetical protein